MKNRDNTVVIFPYAGGSRDSFNKWKFSDAERLTLDYHNLPDGRGKADNIEELSSRLAEYLKERLEGRKFSVFAYSMGSIIAYCTVKKLMKSYGICPENFFTVGCVSPDRFPPQYISFEKKDIERQFKSMDLFGGRKMRDDIFQNFILPAIEGDFEMARTYRAEASETLPVSIYAFMSDDDGFVRKEDVLSWETFTSEDFSFTKSGQGHFSFMVGEGKKLLLNFIEDKINR